MLVRVASILSVVVFLQLLSLSVKISHVCKYYTDYLSTNLWEAVNSPVTQEYDFIVVGAGSAGCVVANRLSKHNRVLLLEAGGTPFYANHVPLMASFLLHTSEVDYMYKTVPQKNTLQGQYDKVSYWPRGKLIGGTSNLNYMMYVRGHPFDYDNWANITKDDSWSYKNLLKHFKRSIDYNGNFASDDDINYGYLYGTQHVEPFHDSPIFKTWMDAGKELGFESNIDTNGPQRTGFGPSDGNFRKGKRETSYTAFIEPILDRENLVISKYSQAVKIKLDGSNNRAVGVWYVQHGKRKFAKAKKEVIVSAGSVDSPKLLMLSGIGPEKHLRDIGINARVSLPVGENLKDHLITFLMPFTTNRSMTFRPDKHLGIFDLIEYYTKGTGVLTTPLGTFSQAFVTTDLAKKENIGKPGLADWTDIQILIINSSPHSQIASDFSRIVKIRKDILDQTFRDSVRDSKDGFIVCVTLGRPKSVGSITLASKDPFQYPVIDPNYLSHPDDISRIIQGVKFVFRIVETTKAFQELNTTYYTGPIKDCKMHEFKSDEYWDCYVRHMAVTMYHPVSTCRMGGGLNDKHSVVDSQLRVLRTKGLRIADASVMPDIINGNTNAPTVMIGEKASDIVRGHWAKQYLVCTKLEILFERLSHLIMCFYSRLT